MQICIFIFWKAMLQIASQNFPELNALNFFSVTVKDMGLPDSQREINLVIFHLNYILIHLNILPYSVLNWEYLKMYVSIRYNIDDCPYSPIPMCNTNFFYWLFSLLKYKTFKDIFSLSKKIKQFPFEFQTNIVFTRKTKLGEGVNFSNIYWNGEGGGLKIFARKERG